MAWVWGLALMLLSMGACVAISPVLPLGSEINELEDAVECRCVVARRPRVLIPHNALESPRVNVRQQVAVGSHLSLRLPPFGDPVHLVGSGIMMRC